ncbi:hypothetical protein EJ08DRAFT_720210 [Tothia fuscella]|uniref:Aminoglycoside phosphotransferase domain-containing protein n=1 Tax=Tothia fuscella TaxID=1048955 RepID=A0A9P4P2B2_9PEZI|nr:hypothetical protein EJ08DRAFT_720210 [Tothia fuscella]
MTDHGQLPLEDKENTKASASNTKWDPTYHPRLDSTTLVHVVDDVVVDNAGWWKGTPQSGRFSPGRHVNEELCYNCGWNTNMLRAARGYTSRLKAVYVRGNYALYEVGPNWLLRDEINTRADGAADDSAAQAHLKAKGLDKLLPLVEMHRYGGGLDEKFAFTIMSRARGVQLSEVSRHLTEEQKWSLGSDLARYIKTWRSLTSDRLETGDGKQLRDFPFMCRNLGPCRDVPYEEHEWLRQLTPTFRKLLLASWKETPLHEYSINEIPEMLRKWTENVDKDIVQLKADLLKDYRPPYMTSTNPPSSRYVFTHGDLNETNIFVEKDESGKFRISAIIDWEFAGYWPWWAESLGQKTCLRGYMPEDGFCPGYDPEALWGLMDEGTTMGRILNDLSLGGYDMFKHTPSGIDEWIRPPFCKCKPYVQLYEGRQAKGTPYVHYTEVHTGPVKCDDKTNYFEDYWDKLVELEQDKLEAEAAKLPEEK